MKVCEIVDKFSGLSIAKKQGQNNHCLPKVVGVMVRVDGVRILGNERRKGGVDFTQMLQRFSSIVRDVKGSFFPWVLFRDFGLVFFGLGHLDF